LEKDAPSANDPKADNAPKPDAEKKPRVKAKDRREAERRSDNRRRRGSEDWEEPASEDYANWKAKQAEEEGGKEARREAHDKKDLSGDRTERELDEDYD
jgi:hypothetical protein